jgi:hypothetical protein
LNQRLNDLSLLYFVTVGLLHAKITKNLVGGFKDLDYVPSFFGIILPIDELIFFRAVKTTNQI